MTTELVELDKTDSSGRLWVVPERVVSIEPHPENPAQRSVLTLAGGHRFTVIGSVAEVSRKLRGPIRGSLGMHAQIDLAPPEPCAADDR